MIARNKQPVCIGSGLNPGSVVQIRRNFVRVHVSYRMFSRGWAFLTGAEQKTGAPPIRMRLFRHSLKPAGDTAAGDVIGALVSTCVNREGRSVKKQARPGLF
jgi:hypothetical protein